VVRGIESGALILVFAAILTLPLAEILLRQFGKTVPTGAAIAQHATFWLGLIGALVATRQGKLLSLSAGFPKLQGWKASVIGTLRCGFGAGLALVLARAGWQYVSIERESPVEAFIGVPTWVALAILPAGFILIAWRQLVGPNLTLAARISGGLLAAVIFSILGAEEATPWVSRLGIGLLAAGLICGAPLFSLLGGTAALLFWKNGNPIASLALDHYRLSTNPTLPALPLFTLAGYFLSTGGASKRLVDLCRSITGRSRWGPAILCVVTCSFFTSLTGASGVTILALGGLLLPILVSAHYSEKDSLGLITGSGSLGLLFAPCLPLLLYAIVAEIDMRTMFLGAAVPGLILCVATIAWAAMQAPGNSALADDTLPPFLPSLRAAFWELLVPVIALGSIFSGLATPVEAAAVTAGYCLFIETVIHKDMKSFRQLGQVFVDSGALIGGVLLILGVALGLTNYLVDIQAPAHLVEFVQAHVSSKWVFLLLLIAVLLLVGCLMDVFSAIVVVVPLIVPLGLAYGIDPIHLGALFLANLGLGFLTPPVGMNLFLASYRFNRPMSEILRAVLPLFGVQFITVVLITFVPGLSTWLPGLLGR
jgi:tripartite ATP-independent transporter DctM subunit